MTDQQPKLVTLTNVANEAEAKSLIGLFEEEGISVFMNGGDDLSLFGEDLGDVMLIVKKSDYDQAAKLLEEIEAENTEIDWSQVDVGEPED
jgi:hypothetical protein